jgi:urease subunit gamma/beta
MMNLTPTEMERMTIFTVAEIARRYRSQGIKLSHPEAVALIADEIICAVRKGMSHPEVVDLGCQILTTDDVQPGVREMAPYICVEACFEEGTKLVTVFDPIKKGKEQLKDQIVPGEIITTDQEIEVNAGRERVAIEVTNTGDRAIQVRSHAHFFEVNRALEFDRAKAFGMRLDTPSGVGIRFEPGVKKAIDLVKMGGTGKVIGFGNLTNGSIHSKQIKKAALKRARERGYKGA